MAMLCFHIANQHFGMLLENAQMTGIQGIQGLGTTIPADSGSRWKTFAETPKTEYGCVWK